MCPSYPHAVIVPKAVDDEMLVKAAAFRMGGRFPVFSFFHRESRVREIYTLATTMRRREGVVCIVITKKETQ